jgi:hypothetical protein
MKPIVRSPLARAWLKFVMGHVAFLVVAAVVFVAA